MKKLVLLFVICMGFISCKPDEPRFGTTFNNEYITLESSVSLPNYYAGSVTLYMLVKNNYAFPIKHLYVDCIMLNRHSEPVYDAITRSNIHQMSITGPIYRGYFMHEYRDINCFYNYNCAYARINYIEVEYENGVKKTFK